jgi:hypothetical protein
LGETRVSTVGTHNDTKKQTHLHKSFAWWSAGAWVRPS